MIRQVLQVATFVAVAMMTTACGEDPPVARKATQAAAPGAGGRAAAGPRARPAAAKDEAPEAATEPTVEEEDDGGVVVQRFKPARDPFKSIFERSGRQTVGEITHPLQQYTIPQIRLLGIIWGIAEPVALVATPEGEEYVVRTGTPVGTGDGKVVGILPDRIVIVERYYDYRGQLQTEKYEMVLPDEGE